MSTARLRPVVASSSTATGCTVADRDGDGGGVGGDPVGDGVVEAVGAGEPGIRGVDDGAVGVDHDGPVGRRGGLGDAQAVAVGVGVVGQHRDVHRPVPPGRRLVVDRDRGTVGDRDGDGGGVGGDAVGDGVVEGVGAGEPGVRGIGDRTAVDDHGAVARGGGVGDGQGVAVGVGVVGQHRDVDGLVAAGGGFVVDRDRGTVADRDGDGGGVGGDAVGDGVVEGVGAGEPGGRGVGHGPVVVDDHGAVGRGGGPGDGQGVAVGVGVVGQHADVHGPVAAGGGFVVDRDRGAVGDGHGHCGGVAGRVAVGGLVGEAVDAAEPQGRLVGETPVSTGDGAAFRARRIVLRDAEVIAVRVVVVGEDVDLDGGVGLGRRLVRLGDRDPVAHGDPNGALVGAGLVADDVGERVSALELAVGGIGHDAGLARKQRCQELGFPSDHLAMVRLREADQSQVAATVVGEQVQSDGPAVALRHLVLAGGRTTARPARGVGRVVGRLIGRLVCGVLGGPGRTVRWRVRGRIRGHLAGSARREVAAGISGRSRVARRGAVGGATRIAGAGAAAGARDRAVGTFVRGDWVVVATEESRTDDPGRDQDTPHHGGDYGADADHGDRADGAGRADGARGCCGAGVPRGRVAGAAEHEVATAPERPEQPRLGHHAGTGRDVRGSGRAEQQRGEDAGQVRVDLGELQIDRHALAALVEVRLDLAGITLGDGLADVGADVFVGPLARVLFEVLHVHVQERLAQALARAVSQRRHRVRAHAEQQRDVGGLGALHLGVPQHELPALG